VTGFFAHPVSPVDARLNGAFRYAAIETDPEVHLLWFQPAAR
jgi:hypothetical protein